MVQLTVTPAAKAALEEYSALENGACRDGSARQAIKDLTRLRIGEPIDHQKLLDVSQYLVRHAKCSDDELAKPWRLDSLLKGSTIYSPPPPPKPEPTPEYKELMQRLREQEEKRQYERMVNDGPQNETFKQRFPDASFDPAISHGKGPQAEEPDDVTYADVNRQMILIINVLVSIIACSFTIWFAARRWDVPQRLSLSMFGSGLVALAEVAIYLGYIKRIKDAKQKELAKVEKKEILEIWVIDKTEEKPRLLVEAANDSNVRSRRGRHGANCDAGALPDIKSRNKSQILAYEIQQRFMEAVYQSIEHGKVGIFESPTGTGKSLSLICSSLTWLREHKRNQFDDAIAAIEVDEDDPDWMAEHARDARRREMRQMRDELEQRLKAAREREHEVREKAKSSERTLKRRKIIVQDDEADTDESQFLLDEYNSEPEGLRARSMVPEYSVETAKLMEKLGMLPQEQRRSEVEDWDELKVYFCSRTHSQLSQFVGELQRVKLPPGFPPEEESKGSTTGLAEEIKQLPLGSRKNLCINPKVAKLGSQAAINERCIELQQSSTAADRKCPALPNKESADLVLDFRDHALAKIRDIEDLATVGSKLGICPYYASRPAIAYAELVTLPYPLLLQKSAREALGISLRGHVVIIDEAHNLMDAIETIYSTQVTCLQLQNTRASLMTYLQKFRNRLKGSNRVYVTQVVRMVDSLLLFANAKAGANSVAGDIEPSQLMSGKGVDQINVAKLVRYINDSKLARKVEGYIAHASQTENVHNSKADKGIEAATTGVPTLTHVQNFLTALMNPSNEGRFFWAQEGEEVVLRYMLLDPSQHFREIVEDARAVILAGGTMSPMDDYRQQLFPYLPSIETFSCGHLIPTSSLLVRTILSDQDGPLQFAFRSRTAETFSRIGKALLQLAPHVQGGLVIFFPSFGFLEQANQVWRTSSILAKLEGKRPIFWDNRGGSADTTFKAYSDAVTGSNSSKGAILLSVLGGKLSEGINFSNELGRCVVVVGLPFPNLETPEWKAKLQYIDDRAVERGEPKGKASREHAENVCMRTVNQAVGRVIRHKDDWASIVLMDSRYGQERIKNKLPGWIKESFPAGSATMVADVAIDVARFFAERVDGMI
ncbi:ATP-dependent RNA helicase chl1 [Teratosphaeria destructans]|uniref:ATP-dependent DNA helicase CHL1 n=1 Tax=Teratosphaeria destructans TaxID=418781 RepID=A0A9W7W4M0_9PEZI|nr:ATP-dependent RNA helicase chl1 [Teratosphaeria destructans]